MSYMNKNQWLGCGSLSFKRGGLHYGFAVPTLQICTLISLNPLLLAGDGHRGRKVHFSDELSQPNVAGTGLDVGGEVGFYLNRDRCAGAVPTCVVLYNESYENEGEQIENLGKRCRQRQRHPLPNNPTPTVGSKFRLRAGLHSTRSTVTAQVHPERSYFIRAARTDLSLGILCKLVTDFSDRSQEYGADRWKAPTRWHYM